MSQCKGDADNWRKFEVDYTAQGSRRHALPVVTRRLLNAAYPYKYSDDMRKKLSALANYPKLYSGYECGAYKVFTLRNREGLKKTDYVCTHT